MMPESLLETKTLRLVDGHGKYNVDWELLARQRDG